MVTLDDLLLGGAVGFAMDRAWDYRWQIVAGGRWVGRTTLKISTSISHWTVEHLQPVMDEVPQILPAPAAVPFTPVTTARRARQLTTRDIETLWRGFDRFVVPALEMQWQQMAALTEAIGRPWKEWQRTSQIMAKTFSMLAVPRQSIFSEASLEAMRQATKMPEWSIPAIPWRTFDGLR